MNKTQMKRFIMNKRLAAMAFVLLIAACGILLFTLSAHNAKAARPQILNYETVQVTAQDTLWKIAKEHYVEEYGSLKDYIKEIKRCNSLSSDYINAGSSLMVPIYAVISTEEK